MLYGPGRRVRVVSTGHGVGWAEVAGRRRAIGKKGGSGADRGRARRELWLRQRRRTAVHTRHSPLALGSLHVRMRQPTSLSSQFGKLVASRYAISRFATQFRVSIRNF
eukprot:1329312-Rhodomonas_salina.2